MSCSPEPRCVAEGAAHLQCGHEPDRVGGADGAMALSCSGARLFLRKYCELRGPAAEDVARSPPGTRGMASAPGRKDAARPPSPAVTKAQLSA
jgi:hypothetical protein